MPPKIFQLTKGGITNGVLVSTVSGKAVEVQAKYIKLG